jgi:PAS domain-containing protein
MWRRERFNFASLLIAAFAAMPSHALAQTADVGPQLGEGLLLALGVMIGAIVMTAWALWHRQIAIDRSLNAEAALRFDHLLLEQGPASYMAIHPNGDIICSDRVREWLDLSRRPNMVADLADKHGLGEAGAALCAGIEALHEEGMPFSLIYISKASGVALYVVGRRIWADEAEGSLKVVAFSDISDLEADRVDLLKDLKESEERRRLLEASLDAAPFPVWLRDRKLDLVWANKAYVEAVDGTSREIILSRQSELTGTTATAPARELARMAKLGKQPIYDTHYVVVDNQRRSLKIFEIPHKGANAGLVGFALDETDLERLQSELKVYTESHSETLNHLSTPIAIFGADQTLQFYNRAFLDLWRLPEIWLDGQPSHGELLEALRENRRLPEQADFLSWKQAIIDHYTALPEPIEEMWHLPDGRALRVATQPHPMGGLLVIFEDVTDHLALERSYNTLITAQQATLDNLHEAVAVIGSDGRLGLANKNFAKILNLESDFLDASPHISDLLERCRPLLEEAELPWEETKAQIQGYTIKRDPKVGRWLLTTGGTLEFAVVPLPDGATLFTIIDVSDSVKIETALQKQIRALAEAERIKGKFIGSIDGQLRAPLNALIGFAELLHNEFLDRLDERQRSELAAAILSSDEIRRTFEGLLDLSKREAGEHKSQALDEAAASPEDKKTEIS